MLLTTNLLSHNFLVNLILFIVPRGFDRKRVKSENGLASEIEKPTFTISLILFSFSNFLCSSPVYLCIIEHQNGPLTVSVLPTNIYWNLFCHRAEQSGAESQSRTLKIKKFRIKIQIYFKRLKIYIAWYQSQFQLYCALQFKMCSSFHKKKFLFHIPSNNEITLRTNESNYFPMVCLQ